MPAAAGLWCLAIVQLSWPTLLTHVPCAQVFMHHQRSLQPSDTREQSHLLVLYAPICSCIQSSKPRVRQALQVLLTLAGQELGLSESSRHSKDFYNTMNSTLGATG